MEGLRRRWCWSGGCPQPQGDAARQRLAARALARRFRSSSQRPATATSRVGGAQEPGPSGGPAAGHPGQRELHCQRALSRWTRLCEQSMRRRRLRRRARFAALGNVPVGAGPAKSRQLTSTGTGPWTSRSPSSRGTMSRCCSTLERSVTVGHRHGAEAPDSPSRSMPTLMTGRI